MATWLNELNEQQQPKQTSTAIINDDKWRARVWVCSEYDKPKWLAESEWESIQWNEFSKCFCHGRTMHKAEQSKSREKSNVAIRRYTADWLKGIRLLFFFFAFGVRRTFTHLPRWMAKRAWALWGTLIDLSAIFWNHQTQPARSLIHTGVFTDLQLTKRSQAGEHFGQVCVHTSLTDSNNNKRGQHFADNKSN